MTMWRRTLARELLPSVLTAKLDVEYRTERAAQLACEYADVLAHETCGRWGHHFPGFGMPCEVCGLCKEKEKTKDG